MATSGKPPPGAEPSTGDGEASPSRSGLLGTIDDATGDIIANSSSSKLVKIHLPEKAKLGITLSEIRSNGESTGVKLDAVSPSSPIRDQIPADFEGNSILQSMKIGQAISFRPRTVKECSHAIYKRQGGSTRVELWLIKIMETHSLSESTRNASNTTAELLPRNKPTAAGLTSANTAAKRPPETMEGKKRCSDGGGISPPKKAARQLAAEPTASHGDLVVTVQTQAASSFPGDGSIESSCVVKIQLSQKTTLGITLGDDKTIGKPKLKQVLPTSPLQDKIPADFVGNSIIQSIAIQGRQSYPKTIIECVRMIKEAQGASVSWPVRIELSLAKTKDTQPAVVTPNSTSRKRKAPSDLNGKLQAPTEDVTADSETAKKRARLAVDEEGGTGESKNIHSNTIAKNLERAQERVGEKDTQESDRPATDAMAAVAAPITSQPDMTAKGGPTKNLTKLLVAGKSDSGDRQQEDQPADASRRNTQKGDRGIAARAPPSTAPKPAKKNLTGTAASPQPNDVILSLHSPEYKRTLHSMFRKLEGGEEEPDDAAKEVWETLKRKKGRFLKLHRNSNEHYVVDAKTALAKIRDDIRRREESFLAWEAGGSVAKNVEREKEIVEAEKGKTLAQVAEQRNLEQEKKAPEAQACKQAPSDATALKKAEDEELRQRAEQKRQDAEQRKAAQAEQRKLQQEKMAAEAEACKQAGADVAAKKAQLVEERKELVDQKRQEVEQRKIELAEKRRDEQDKKEATKPGQKGHVPGAPTTGAKTDKKKVPKPKGPSGAIIYYQKEVRPGLLAQHPKATVPEIAKMVGAKWRSLADKEKQPYIKLSRQDNVRYKKEMEAHRKSMPSGDVEPPSCILRERIQSLPVLEQRKNIQEGMRVKVRFVEEIEGLTDGGSKGKGGEKTKETKWYPGAIAKILDGGKKIQINYDDGTEETATFPDEDIFVEGLEDLLEGTGSNAREGSDAEDGVNDGGALNFGDSFGAGIQVGGRCFAFVASEWTAGEYPGQGEWSPGEVTAKQGKGFLVEFDDGVEDELPAIFLVSEDEFGLFKDLQSSLQKGDHVYAPRWANETKTGTPQWHSGVVQSLHGSHARRQFNVGFSDGHEGELIKASHVFPFKPRDASRRNDQGASDTCIASHDPPSTSDQAANDPTETAASPQPAVVVNPNDVVLSLCNQEYRRILHSMFRKLEGGEEEPDDAAKEVWEALKTKEGRFLKLDQRSKEHCEVDDKTALKKIRQDIGRRQESRNNWVTRRDAQKDGAPAQEQKGAADSAAELEEWPVGPDVEEQGEGAKKEGDIPAGEVAAGTDDKNTPGEGASAAEDFSQWSRDELRAKLKELHLSQGKMKQDMVDALTNHFHPNPKGASTGDALNAGGKKVPQKADDTESKAPSKGSQKREAGRSAALLHALDEIAPSTGTRSKEKSDDHQPQDVHDDNTQEARDEQSDEGDDYAGLTSVTPMSTRDEIYERAKRSLANKSPIPAVTVKPSGKWQVQLYYQGKSRYIGVFDSKLDAAVASELARKVMDEFRAKDDIKQPSKDEAEKNVAIMRKAALSFLDEANNTREMDNKPQDVQDDNTEEARDEQSKDGDDSVVIANQIGCEETDDDTGIASHAHLSTRVEIYERAKRSLANELPRGINQRPSGKKWEVQMYYQRKMRYIGRFETKLDATVAYELAREVVSELNVKDESEQPSDDQVEKNVVIMRKAALSFLDDKVHTSSKKQKKPNEFSTAQDARDETEMDNTQETDDETHDAQDDTAQETPRDEDVGNDHGAPRRRLGSPSKTNASEPKDDASDSNDEHESRRSRRQSKAPKRFVAAPSKQGLSNDEIDDRATRPLSVGAPSDEQSKKSDNSGGIAGRPHTKHNAILSFLDSDYKGLMYAKFTEIEDGKVTSAQAENEIWGMLQKQGRLFKLDHSRAPYEVDAEAAREKIASDIRQRNKSRSKWIGRQGTDDDTGIASQAPLSTRDEIYERAERSLANKLPRGITQRPSGKWQVQMYYQGKSRYIGVFESKLDAAVAYELASEVVSELRSKDDLEQPSRAQTEKNVASMRKAAFSFLDDEMYTSSEKQKEPNSREARDEIENQDSLEGGEGLVCGDGGEEEMPAQPVTSRTAVAVLAIAAVFVVIRYLWQCLHRSSTFVSEERINVSDDRAYENVASKQLSESESVADEVLLEPESDLWALAQTIEFLTRLLLVGCTLVVGLVAVIWRKMALMKHEKRAAEDALESVLGELDFLAQNGIMDRAAERNILAEYGDPSAFYEQ